MRSGALGDFNGDGNQDLVATNGTATSVSVLLGNGDGTFRPPLIFDAGGSPVSVAVGNFNSDQVQDLAVTGSFPGTFLLLGNGDGTFASAVSYTAARSTREPAARVLPGSSFSARDAPSSQRLRASSSRPWRCRR
jgi:hypothetical protein